LSYSLTEAELKTYFEGYDIKDVFIVKNKLNGRLIVFDLVCIVISRSRGFGFIEFSSPADQQRALFEKANSTINYRQVRNQFFL
jgi:RNA recognition motif-containing protein